MAIKKIEIFPEPRPGIVDALVEAWTRYIDQRLACRNPTTTIYSTKLPKLRTAVYPSEHEAAFYRIKRDYELAGWATRCDRSSDGSFWIEVF